MVATMIANAVVEQLGVCAHVCVCVCVDKELYPQIYLLDQCSSLGAHPWAKARSELVIRSLEDSSFSPARGAVFVVSRDSCWCGVLRGTRCPAPSGQNSIYSRSSVRWFL